MQNRQFSNASSIEKILGDQTALDEIYKYISESETNEELIA